MSLPQGSGELKLKPWDKMPRRSLRRGVDPKKIQLKEIYVRRVINMFLPLAVPTVLMAYMHMQNAIIERREKVAREAAEKRRLQFRHM
jgi:hypothetical protein